MYKQILYLLFVLIFTNQLKAQSDSLEIQQSGYFLTFIKKVYLNPTVYLRTQDFKERTNLSFVALPDLASEKTNASSGFEKGLQKVLRFLMQSDGGVRFYFNPDSITHPFRFWYSENLGCKFKQADKDSIDYYLNHNFADGNISMTNALRFETTIDKALDYIEKCLTANPQACGDDPQNETTEINTKPLSISLHNRVNSQYDIDEKQYDKLESYYANAFDVFTQQDWYAPSKLLVANETDEPVAIAIHSNEGDFLKQNIKIEVLKTHALLPIEQSSTEDSLFFKLPSSLPTGDPVEVIVKYKSPKDSLTYTVGFFMVNVMARKTKNLVLIPANGFVISPEFRDSVENELEKIYGQASVDFNVTVESVLFPSEYPTTIEIESSNLFSNYAPDLRDYVSDIIDNEGYDDNNYYVVVGLKTSLLDGYMPRARNIGFIFEDAINKPNVIAHEIGHGAFHFRHIFSEEELGVEEEGQTKNIMDYVSNPNDLYLHQWNFIKDPAFVSWFGGDDEDAAFASKNIAYYFWQENEDGSLKSFTLEGTSVRFLKGDKYSFKTNKLLRGFTFSSIPCYSAHCTPQIIETMTYHDKFQNNYDDVLNAKSIVDTRLKDKTKTFSSEQEIQTKIVSEMYIIRNNKLLSYKDAYPSRGETENNYVLYFNSKNGKLFYSHCENKISLEITNIDQKVFTHMYVIRKWDDGKITEENVYDWNGKLINEKFKSKVLIIYVNGYIYGTSPGISDDCTPLGPYWRSSSKNSEEFIQASKEFFDDSKTGYEYYLNGTTSTMFSSSPSRFLDGINAAKTEIPKIKKLIEERKINGDELTEINFVTHSMGAAYSEGLIVEMLKDPILKSLLINGEIVHFSAADAGDIPKRTDGLKRYQINYKWDYTLAYADGWNDGDGYGGERLDGANKRAVVFAESFEQQLNTLHNGQTDWDFHFDTKTYKNAWDALIILKDPNSSLQVKEGWSWINANRIK